jgi:alpha-L-rhamnosidase
MLTAKGLMSYQRWIDIGATTLYEFFHENTYSCNHHMYSAVVAWFHNTILGIHHSHSESGHKIEIAPIFIDGLDYANGSYTTDFGDVFVSWKRICDSVELFVRIPEGMTAALKLSGYYFDGKTEMSVTGDGTFVLTKIN